VPTLQAEPGSRVEIQDVLLVSDGGKVSVGSPTVADAMVVAEVLEHGKGRKVINFKYKAKVRYRRKHGHRQGYTALRVQEILTDGARPSTATRSAARRTAEAEEAAASDDPGEATPAAPRRRRASAESDETPSAPSTRRRRTPEPAPDTADDSEEEH
jgi:large subunit ribosomal protein L21